MNKINLENQKVMVTGGESMIGNAICESLQKRNCIIDTVPHNKCNLLSIVDTAKYISNFSPDYLIHAAGWNGGIKWNKDYPATIYKRTAYMALNVLTSAMVEHKDKNLKKCVSILASCSYPESNDEEFKEHTIWRGKSNDTVECHGMSKRILLDYSRQLYKQHSLPSICCILTNSYGEGDSYHSDKTKVVGALIRKFVEAKQNNLQMVTCWGTGNPLREFMYSKDAGEAIVQALETYCGYMEPINIGSGQEISIAELSYTIAKCVGYMGEITWDSSKLDGQMKKKLNTEKMKKYLNVNITPLEEGLQKTIDWYINNKEVADAKGF